MGGYGGRPPGWNDPYGPNTGWSDPYAKNPYGYGPPGIPHGAPSSNGPIIAAVVCNSVITALCCNVFAIPGIITSAIALNRASTDPRSARTLLVWSWVIFGVSIVVWLALVIILAALDASNTSGDDTYNGV
ncbi:hypothetical protein [Spirillospora sp. CA-294931]|uniref:hypothetical protein n=1 Tax=Spirillospora sp. CA-294931 TaxID=3240042 RepID=UPI003D944EF1